MLRTDLGCKDREACRHQSRHSVEIVALRPDWHSDADDTGKVKVVYTADPGDEADAILDLAPPEPEASNWRSLLIVAAGVLLFVALLQPLGWLIAGSLLFAVVGFGLGARSPLGLVLGGVGMTSAIQIVFSGFLGIHVPAGILG